MQNRNLDKLYLTEDVYDTSDDEESDEDSDDQSDSDDESVAGNDEVTVTIEKLFNVLQKMNPRTLHLQIKNGTRFIADFTKVINKDR